MLRESYERRDEKGRLVKIEFWREQETRKITMFRKTTYFANGLKFRSDFPSDCEEFLDALDKEIRDLNEGRERLDEEKERLYRHENLIKKLQTEVKAQQLIDLMSK